MLREYHLIAGLTDWLVPVRFTVCLRVRIVSLHFHFFFFCECEKALISRIRRRDTRQEYDTYTHGGAGRLLHTCIDNREREREKKAANEHKY